MITVIVGGAGVGKTTIARAIGEKSKSSFGTVVIELDQLCHERGSDKVVNEIKDVMSLPFNKDLILCSQAGESNEEHMEVIREVSHGFPVRWIRVKSERVCEDDSKARIQDVKEWMLEMFGPEFVKETHTEYLAAKFEGMQMRIEELEKELGQSEFISRARLKLADEEGGRIKHLKRDLERARKLPGPRPVVQWFAQKMERRLRENDHKSGWEDESVWALMDLLRSEVDELTESLPLTKEEVEDDDGWVSDCIIGEAVDVANFAMMIADVAMKRGSK
jgi:ABC-type oligopeptide transport system ATPase subunit